MKSILNELINGGLLTIENIIPDNKDYDKKGDEIEEEMEFWQKELSKENFSRLEDFRLKLLMLTEMELYETYRYGFSLAVSLLTEAYGYQNKLLRD